MSMMSNWLEDQLRTHLFRTGTMAKTTGRWVSLHTADPTDAGTGTEVTGGSYARQSYPASDANWTVGTPTDGLTANANVITWAAAPTANWGVCSHYAIWDAVSAGNMITYAAITPGPKTINNGDPAPAFAIGALVVTFA